MRSNTLIANLSLVAAASAATIVIDVGESGLAFSPSSSTAAVGDTLEFHFYPRDHSVVQGSFDAPCSQGSMTTGFNSGLMPVSSGEGAKVFQVMVKDTNPMWFYCSESDHCQSGMVGVINPPASGNTLAAYKAAAALTSQSQTPAAVQGGVLVAAGASGGSSMSGAEMSSSASGGAMSATSAMEMTSAAASPTSADMTSNMGSMTSTASMTEISSMGGMSTMQSPATTSSAPLAQSTNGGAQAMGMPGRAEILGLTAAVVAVAAFMI